MQLLSQTFTPVKRIQRVLTRTASVALLSFACLGANTARAQGIPTFDAANLAQAINQVLAWSQQYSQMVQQIQQYQTMIQGMTGGRFLGTILNDPAIRAALPEEFNDAALLLSALQSPNVAAQIPGILSAYGIQLPTLPQQGTTLSLENAAGVIAWAKNVNDSILNQNTDLEQLAVKIDTTADSKESTDLVSRSVLELARITNTQTQVIANIEAQKEQRRLREIAEGQAQYDLYVQRAKALNAQIKSQLGY